MTSVQKPQAGRTVGGEKIKGGGSRSFIAFFESTLKHDLSRSSREDSAKRVKEGGSIAYSRRRGEDDGTPETKEIRTRSWAQATLVLCGGTSRDIKDSTMRKGESQLRGKKSQVNRAALIRERREKGEKRDSILQDRGSFWPMPSAAF